jgi:hypothetical protein
MPGNASAVWSAPSRTLNVAGVDISTAIGDEDGEFLKFEKASEDVGYKGSANGFGTFFTKGNKLVKATITLPQASPDIQKLSAIHKTALATLAPFPVTSKDGLGTSKMLADSCMFEKDPDETIATEPGTIQFVLLIHDPARFVGGH